MKSSKNHPPRWAVKFLKWYCRPELLEEIEGDLYELFEIRNRRKSAEVARRRFAWDVLRSFRLSTIRNINVSPMLLFKSNLKIAFRHLLKQKMYSAIKIGGFALGVAACLLIALFIQDELRYDRHIPEGDRIYRVLGTFEDDGETLKGVHFPAPFAKALKEDYPEVEKVGRFLASELFGAGSKELRRTDRAQNNYEEGFVFADQELLDIFQIEMAYGERENALAEPNTIVFSKSKAEKYFPGEDPIGKTLILDNDEENPFKIGGVMKDLPKTSHFQYDFLITLTGLEFWPGEQNFWRANNYHTYALLNPKVDPEKLETKMRGIIEDYVIPSNLEAGMADAVESSKNTRFILQPLIDIHLKSRGVHDRLSHGDIRFVWLFGAIALFILLIACVNFINLSTAKSANRAKEVGLRKVVGSFRKQIIGQFLTESVLFSFLSFGLGLILAQLLLPFFNRLADKSIIFPWQEWQYIPLLILAAIIVGVLAGLYPSFYLSSFRPINVLKGNLSKGSKSSRMRSALVIFQFTTSIVLIIGAIIIYRQMSFILNKKLGFEKEQVVLLQGAASLDDQVTTFKKELLQMSQVKNVTVSDYLPIQGTKRNGNGFWREGKVTEDRPIYGQIWRVDHDYIKTMSMEIVEGRDFSIDMASDSQAVIINKTLANKFGFENPIGQRITNSSSIWPIIGVVEDFHFESMKEDIEGLCLVIGNSPSTLSVKVNTTDMPHLIQRLTKVWDDFSPNQPIRYAFLDERFEVMYSDVQRMGRIFSSFAILAIIVACLGLFALSAFMAEQRSKEISIRKVLGASVNNIVGLLTHSFLRLVLISLLIAVPLGWFLMKKWLQDFAYRTTISWDVFVFAGLLALLIALLTISFQAIRAATGNPAKTLRSE